MQLAAQFPKPEGPEVIIDVSQFEERQLTAVSGDTYPLIIRLECVSDKGKTESHSLQVYHFSAHQHGCCCFCAFLCTSAGKMPAHLLFVRESQCCLLPPATGQGYLLCLLSMA